MSNIVSKLIRVDDRWVLSLKIEINKLCDYSVVDFTPGTKICSASGGNIIGSHLIMDEKNAVIYILYQPNTSYVECFITHFVEHKPIYETIKVSIENPPMTTVAQVVPKQAIKAKLSVSNDIAIEMSELCSSWISFGEKSPQVLASDFVTQICEQKNIVIPIEVFWDKVGLYAGNEVGVFELTPAGPNVFHKQLISNLLKTSDFPRKQVVMHSFVSPVGELINLDHNNG